MLFTSPHVDSSKVEVCDSDEENGRRKKMIKKTTKKTMKKKAILDPLPLPPPKLPAQFRERIASMEGYEVVLVIQKRLYKSDVDGNACRMQ
ncbi:hypothetical protein U1Q18_001469 [Sarracenia purpurea var. burkii]